MPSLSAGTRGTLQPTQLIDWARVAGLRLAEEAVAVVEKHLGQ